MAETHHTTYLVFGIKDTEFDVLTTYKEEYNANEMVEMLQNDAVEDENDLNHNPENYDSFLYRGFTATITS